MVDRPAVAAAFLAFIAIGELVRLRLPGDREAAPIGAAGALAYCLLPQVGSAPARHSPAQVVAVTALGMVLGVLPHVWVGRGPGLLYVARRLVVIGTAAVVFRPMADSHLGPLLAAAMVAVVIGVAALDAALAGLMRARQLRAPLRPALRDEFAGVLGIGSAIGATGMLIALAVGVMNLWAIPVFCAPLLLTQLSFRRITAIRATYRQTVRSLSRTTELGGYTPEGHARRVSDLALAVGRELGLGEADLLDLEYAALMHDLGQLSLDLPVHGGATIYVDPGEQRRLAEEAAKVVRATGVPAEVAEIVERQAEPYRRPHEAIDPTLPLGARILKVANAFDDLAGDAPARDTALSALERLRHGMAYDYDPRVVEVLSGVVGRAG
ncbi:MAG TPA: HD domain-containing phosphohydrolase [Sporichthyaceae bacterium]